MYFLAVVQWAVPPEQEYSWLASQLGITAYDVRMRSGGKPPVVIRTAPEREALETLADGLRKRGHDVLLYSGDDFEKWRDTLLEPRRFLLGEEKLSFPSADNVEIPYRRVAVVMQALLKRTTVSTTVEKKRKLAVGRAIVTAGLVARKTVEKTYRKANEDREKVLYLLCEPPLPCARLREHKLQYAGLEQLLMPSRAENFSTLVQLIRRRALGALFQDRGSGPSHSQTVTISGGMKKSQVEYSNLLENDLTAFMLLRGLQNASP